MMKYNCLRGVTTLGKSISKFCAEVDIKEQWVKELLSRPQNTSRYMPRDSKERRGKELACCERG